MKCVACTLAHCRRAYAPAHREPTHLLTVGQVQGAEARERRQGRHASISGATGLRVGQQEITTTTLFGRVDVPL
eukprot:1142327-Pelagomonas_calceolata.AAC.4